MTAECSGNKKTEKEAFSRKKKKKHNFVPWRGIEPRPPACKGAVTHHYTTEEEQIRAKYFKKRFK